jgi:hypothetical protein
MKQKLAIQQTEIKTDKDGRFTESQVYQHALYLKGARSSITSGMAMLVIMPLLISIIAAAFMVKMRISQ